MPTAITEIDRRAVPSRGRVLVLWEGGSVTKTLPRSGALVIGRSTRCDLQVDHRSMSRRHLAFHVSGSDEDTALTVEDLGSSNGSILRGARLVAGQPSAVRWGEVIEVGADVLVVVQGPNLGADAVTVPTSRTAALDHDMVAESEVTQRLVRQAQLVAAGDIPVLIQGETGAGKEVFARLVHRSSPRAHGPFVVINCAALPEGLVESELFGHEKGAFSGADRSKAGLVEAAHGGTLVLDEVGELPLAAQAKLLRALDAKEVLRVGAVAPTPVDIRVVSATHRPLVAMVEDGRFRRDLLFRLSGLTLEVPPLRRRPEDLRALAERFFGARASQVTTDAWDLLLAHPWPGNVRELHHVVERAVLLAAGGPITATHLQLAPPPASSSPAPAPTVMTPSTGPLADDLRAIERDRILNALAAAGGNQTKAAAELGMPRRTFVSRLDAYGIPRPRKGR